MLILLLSIILRRSSIVAAAAKCFMFRKRTRLKWFMGIQTPVHAPKKATWRSMNPYPSPNFLHIFTSLMQDYSESTAPQGKKKIRFLNSFERLKYFPLCGFPMSSSATLVWSHPEFCCVVVGLTPCRQLSWAVAECSRLESSASFSHHLCWSWHLCICHNSIFNS